MKPFYFIAMKSFLFIFFVLSLGYLPMESPGQRYNVTGRVIDTTTQLPVNQFPVVEKNSRTVTITNSDGQYSLLLKKGEVDIVFEGAHYTPANVLFELQKDTIVNVNLLVAPIDRNRRARKEISSLAQTRHSAPKLYSRVK